MRQGRGLSEHWPGTTGPPQNRTHRVVRGDPVARDTWEYLKAPEQRDSLPQWTSYPDEGAIWTEAYAEQLAKIHRAHLSAPRTAWTVALRRARGKDAARADTLRAKDEDDLKTKKLARRRFKIRDRLQAIEDELIEAGYNDFVVATDRGSFQWLAQKAARQLNAPAQPGSGLRNSRTKSALKGPQRS